MSRFLIVVSVTLALAACSVPKTPPPMIKDRGCGVIDPYTGRVSDIKPDRARVWAAGVNAGLAKLCQDEAR